MVEDIKTSICHRQDGRTQRDLRSRPARQAHPVDLTNVSLTDALRIVGTVSGTSITGDADTIFVAQNNTTKHKDLDDLAVQTFY